MRPDGVTCMYVTCFSMLNTVRVLVISVVIHTEVWKDKP